MTPRCLYYSHARNVAQGNPSVEGHPNQPWTPPSPVLTVHEPVLVELEQRSYGHVVHGHVVEFKTLDGRGIDLHQAFNGEFGELDGKDQPAFPSYMDVKAKASIRIQISGIKDYTRQVMSLRSNREATSISKGKLARTIAKEVKKMMGVHLALQMASTCGCPVVTSARALGGRLTSKEEYGFIDNGPAVPCKANASCWPCANRVSPFSSRDRKYGVGGRNGWGVGRSSMRGIELSCIPSFLSVFLVSCLVLFLSRQWRYFVCDSVAHKHHLVCLAVHSNYQVKLSRTSFQLENAWPRCSGIDVSKHGCRTHCGC
ncbi:hypothetical protein GSI_13592 [Ganoderma sinense ZZ0214-1]|uniref:Uncharacterized protein n=1 Tax=Ganoderma sinense ZZ0214-1 TaxID=1077348 RepID=A0A2G8RQS3_9APHY|nr:hypothetical protein GSI_13592 [Ganoderma sinense ZZ0214-1]